MVKLYRSPRETNYWFAYSPITGWVKFPPEINGWDARLPTSIPQDLCEVPLHLAFNTGMLEAIRLFRANAA